MGEVVTNKLQGKGLKRFSSSTARFTCKKVKRHSKRGTAGTDDVVDIVPDEARVSDMCLSGSMANLFQPYFTFQQLVEVEKGSGDFHARQFCAKHGINPVL